MPRNRAGDEMLTTPVRAGVTFAPATSDASPPIEAPTRNTFVLPSFRSAFVAAARSAANLVEAAPVRICENP
jgi:hypothetical protein